MPPDPKLTSVAAGILPAVEPGVSPGGTRGETSTGVEKCGAGPAGKMPASTAGGTPAFTECVSNADGGVSGVNDSRQMARRLQDLIEQIQRQANPAGRALLHECVQSLLAFYGTGLTRVLEHLRAGGAAGESILNEMLHDQAVTGLLFIHGLHPVPLETRLHEALEKVRPYMQSHGGNIELLDFNNDVARVRLQGTCKTCPSSSITLELAVRRAVDEACPDLLGFEVIGADAETPAEEFSASA